MNAKLIGLIVAVVVLVGGGAFYVLRSGSDGSKSKDGAHSELTACDLLTKEIATEAVGEGATKQDTVATTATEKTGGVSNCVYTIGTDRNNIVNASLLLRTAASEEDVKKSFTGSKLKDAVTVEGIGDEAYWSPTLGQLNVLQGDHWLIVSVGPLDAGKRTQAANETVAKALLENL